MRIMDTLKSFFGIHSNDASRRAAVIMQMSDDSVQAARELNEQLKVYTRDDDPFNAMIIDLVNKRAMHIAREK